MLPSPPLTAGSGSSSPRSLKRAYTDTLYDDTPPLSQPLKRRRCSSSAPSPQSQELLRTESTAIFDPAALISPPEYAFTPYDEDFGLKVCQAYKKSLQAKAATDAMTTASRRHKYGRQAAEAYSPGSTPDHLRLRYETKQKQMDELAADIIANSESEGEDGSFESGTSSDEWKTKLLQSRKARRSERRRLRKERDLSSHDGDKKRPDTLLSIKSPPPTTLLRSDDYDETIDDTTCFTTHGRIGMRCTTTDEFAHGRRSFGKQFWSSYIAAS